jgi:hypothetical protein
MPIGEFADRYGGAFLIAFGVEDFVRWLGKESTFFADAVSRCLIENLRRILILPFLQLLCQPLAIHDARKQITWFKNEIEKEREVRIQHKFRKWVKYKSKYSQFQIKLIHNNDKSGEWSKENQ